MADIIKPVQHEGVRRRAVAPGPAQFLVIRFHVAGQVGVEHVAHVGFVDPHAERDGRGHDRACFGHEHFLVRIAGARFHARVIGQGVHTVIA